MQFSNWKKLSHFQISNNEWSSYLSDVVLPHVQKNLHLEFAFKLSLRKMIWEFNTGSSVKLICDKSKEEGMFGMLVIQLPSCYEGGKLIVRHNNRKEEVDFSTASDPQNEFSMFYTALYSDCEYEVQPVTSGIKICLIYNLISFMEPGEKKLPSAAQTSYQARKQDLIDLLRNDWPKDQKLIYCLSQKYSRKNLSFEDLKASDKVIAQLFRDHADQCSLSVVLAVLKKRKSNFVKDVPYVYANGSYYGHAEISSVDSDDLEVDFVYEYQIMHIKTQDTDNVLPKMHVDFESEVIPENGFVNVKAFYKDQLDNSLVRAVECIKLYQCAAILIFKRDDLIPVMIKGHSRETKIEAAYLKEFDKCKDQMANQLVREKFIKWAHDLLDIFLKYSFIKNDTQNTAIFLNDLLLLDDIQLLRKYLQVMNFDVRAIPTLCQICQKYGWSQFSDQLSDVFCKIRAQDRLDFLQKLIENQNKSNNDGDWRNTIHNIRIAILDKIAHELKDPKNRNSYPWYCRELNQNILDNILLLDDVSLLKKYFHLLRFDDNFLPSLCSMFQQYGWTTLSKQIIEKFEKMQEYQRLRYLKSFMEFDFDNNDTDRQSVFQRIMKAIAERFDYEIDRAPRWIKRNEKIEKTKKFLIQLWPIAKQLDSSYLVNYAKSKTFEAAVPALVELSQNKSSKNFNNAWVDVAYHYKMEMENALQRETEAPRTWELSVKIGCTCKDCRLVNNFLVDPYQKIFKFRGIHRRRVHVEENLKEFPVQCSTNVKDQLRISKIEKTGLPKSKIRDFILAFMPQLCSMLPVRNN